MMKRLNSILLLCLGLVMSIGFTSCEDTVDVGDMLPDQAKDLIYTYWGKQVSMSVSEGQDRYEVLLGNGMFIRFDKAGKWFDIDGFNELALPNGIIETLPASITSFFKESYPTRQISQIEIRSSGYSIEITDKENPTNFIFDQGGNFLRTEHDIDSESVPNEAKAFVKEYFTKVKVARVYSTDAIFEVKFFNGVNVVFNKEGEWQDIDGGNRIALTDALIQLLPDAIPLYLKQHVTADAKISRIKLNKGGYIIELINYKDKQFTFDTEGNFLY